MSDSFSFSPRLTTPVHTFPQALRLLFGTFFLFMILGCASLVWFFQAIDHTSADFPLTQRVVIPEGVSARTATSLLEDEGFVSSKWLLYLVLTLYHDPSSVKAGTYVFDTPQTISTIAEEITAGNVVSDLIKITHIEGERVSDLAVTANTLLSNFDTAAFISVASPLEGRLFPDTYLVPPDFTDVDLLLLMTETFAERVLPLQAQIDTHSLTLEEILIMASILEREANSERSMKMVSGILQNRLRIGMALQVDASIEYVLGKDLQELTAADLEIDTPYNTYLYPGLPPTPIGNPGLLAIMAVLEPTPSEYLFYITGNDGEFYYAKDFNQHRLNIARHLR